MPDCPTVIGVHGSPGRQEIGRVRVPRGMDSSAERGAQLLTANGRDKLRSSSGFAGGHAGQKSDIPPKGSSKTNTPPN
jgi:hypothetical protein